MKSILLFLWVLSISTYLCAQSGAPHPKFSNFIGDAYKMPIIETITPKGYKKKGLQESYGENVYDYPKIGEIDLPELKIPETYIDEGQFPGVDRNTQYAMVLEAKMTITTRACYEFSLNSDDGSILWINGEKIVDNDGGHGMRMRKDSVVYDAGDYDVKVWYFQGLADRFGIELDAKIVGRAEVCGDQDNQQRETATEKINIQEEVLFDVSSSHIKAAGMEELKLLAAKIQNDHIKEITIIGHTDSNGTEKYNLSLSQRRAKSTASALKLHFENEIKIVTKGLGEQQPIASNDTEAGRAKNRRVEIILKM